MTSSVRRYLKRGQGLHVTVNPVDSLSHLPRRWINVTCKCIGSILKHGIDQRKGRRLEQLPIGHLNDLLCILDRKSTRLNSSHQIISYAVFCLKKKISLHYTMIDPMPALQSP